MIVRQYAPCSLGRSIICLGKQGEINALRVEFDVSAWMAMYPDATVKLMHFAPDRPQDNPVIPTLGVEGTLRVWIVGEEDTAGAGNGVIELLLIDERTGSTIKSATGYTTVLRSPSAGIEAQEPEPGYVRYDVDQSALLTDTQKAFARTNIDAIKDEKDPTVPDWAKQPRKPTYTASEVGALPSSYTPPVTSVNGMTGAVALSAQDVGARPDTWTPSASEVGADAAGTASGAVAAHNVSGAAHADLRALIDGLNSRLNALADSDDTTLDQLSEIVAYIKSNRTLIDAVTTGKVSASDIVDNLTTNASGKVLSAAQGVALKAMIDGIVIPSALPNPQPITINGQRYDGSEAVTVTTVEIDDTLTQIGKAADAKAVGDQLSALNEANAAQDTEIAKKANKDDLIDITETYTEYEWIETPAEQSTGRILVGWNDATYPDGCWLNKGKDSYSYKKFDCEGIAKFKIAYSSVQNKVANYAFYDEYDNLVSIYPTSAIGGESQISNHEVDVPKNAKWFYVIVRTSSISTYGFKIYKSVKIVSETLNYDILQKTVDIITSSEATGFENTHIVTEESEQKNIITIRNEFKYPHYPFFGGEYLEHWYEKIYDGTENIVVDIEGDSISQGYTGENCFLGMKDYAIKKIMKNGGYDLSKLTVFNNAIGGCSTNDWVGRTEYFKGPFQTEQYYTKYAQGMLHYGMEQNPDLMIIGFGMNDANISTDSLNLKQRLNLFESNFREALQRIRGNESINGREAYSMGVDSLSIIITNITNTKGYEERKLANWHIYANDIIKKLCHEFMCAYVDFTTLTYGYTTEYNIFSQINSDGKRVSLHPNKYQIAYLMSQLNDLIYPVAMHNIAID